MGKRKGPDTHRGSKAGREHGHPRREDAKNGGLRLGYKLSSEEQILSSLVLSLCATDTQRAA